MGERRFVRFLPWLVLAIVPVLLLWPGLRPPQGRWFNAFWNLLHVPAFFFLALALRSVFGFWPAVVVGILVACGSEALQSFGGRSGSIGDVFFDCIGIGLAILWMVRSKSPGLFFWLPAFIIGIACLSPAWKYEYAERAHRSRLPEISAFSTVSGRMLWQPQGNAKVSRDGGLRVEIGRGKYGGVSFHPGEQDWSNYSEIVLKVTNPGSEFRLGIRIDDVDTGKVGGGKWHSSSVEVVPGENDLLIPLKPSTQQGMVSDLTGLSRSKTEIDLSRVARLVLFTGEEEKKRVFVINSAFLRR